MSTSTKEIHDFNHHHARFRQRLLQGELLVGCFVKTPHYMVAEVLAQTELDCLCFDAEHSPFDRQHIDSSVLCSRLHNMPSLIRVPNASSEHILNALDCGATGVVLPHIDSVAKAKLAAQQARFGDRGRGYAGSTRAAGYGSRSIIDNLESNQENVVIAQIEDLDALENIDQICALNTIDCLFIGTMDLTVALAATSPNETKVVEAMEMICATAHKHDKRVGIFIPNISDAPYWQERGVNLFLLSSDHAFLKAGAANLVAALKSPR